MSIKIGEKLPDSLGRVFHAPPNVLHYGREGTGPLIEEGMFFTIEPMVNWGRPETKVLSDEWTAVTRDKSLSAQFEHSIGVTKDGAEIFTLSPKNKFHPTYSYQANLLKKCNIVSPYRLVSSNLKPLSELFCSPSSKTISALSLIQFDANADLTAASPSDIR